MDYMDLAVRCPHSLPVMGASMVYACSGVGGGMCWWGGVGELYAE